jgi:hypothetical protein
MYSQTKAGTTYVLIFRTMAAASKTHSQAHNYQALPSLKNACYQSHLVPYSVATLRN